GVAAPGVFLRAVSVLERQLVAYSMTRWLQSAPGSKIPGRLHDALLRLKGADGAGSFPEGYLAWLQEHADEVHRGFCGMFSRGGSELSEDAAAGLRAFLAGDGGERKTLACRVRESLEKAGQQDEDWRREIQLLKKRLSELERLPADEQKANEISAVKQQRAAYQNLLRDHISGKNTFNFFTDEGLLPNYAFPEEGVSVTSIILKQSLAPKEGEEGRTTGKGEGKGAYKPFRPFEFKFARGASQALSELAPDSRFYAGGYILHVDQVRISGESLERWRICDLCSHAEREIEGAPVSPACPACGSQQWGDRGQARTMIRAREVVAHANARHDRIIDDKETRRSHPQARQTAVEVKPGEGDARWKVDDEGFAFGFEFVRRAVIREVNFGPSDGPGAGAFMAAGRKMPAAGFKVCRECGMVYKKFLRQGEKQHDYRCSWRGRDEAQDGVLDGSLNGDAGGESPWIDGLFLYREMTSEAIRIRVPVNELVEAGDAAGGVESLVAALRLGMKRHFRGAVDHLQILVQEEPARGLQGVRNPYVVIYDAVPGGSGYLKDLGKADPATGRPLVMLQMLREALQAVAQCSCAADPEKDGCYRCLYQYRDNRSRQAISRRAAEALLSRIASYPPEKFVPAGGMGEIAAVDGSMLERMFMKRLESVRDFKVSKSPLKSAAAAYDVVVPLTGTARKLLEDASGVDLGEAMVWKVVPQADFGGDYPSRPDFAVYPKREALRAKLPRLTGLVFTDGWQFHAASLAEDARKRQSLINQGYRVWSLIWEDVKARGEEDQEQGFEFTGLDALNLGRGGTLHAREHARLRPEERHDGPEEARKLAKRFTDAGRSSMRK
ncbi:MAG: DUF1998 domain-containing protein, partial [Duodenibacillus sp.]|nr:DUF1998 domain-containing protein [Duodenibacillus sp.]